MQELQAASARWSSSPRPPRPPGQARTYRGMAYLMATPGLGGILGEPRLG